MTTDQTPDGYAPPDSYAPGLKALKAALPQPTPFEEDFKFKQIL
jgi:hypothetical protein